MKAAKGLVGDVDVLTLTGDVDAGAAELDLLGLMPARSAVLVDLTEVAHLTSAGVRTLLALYRQGQALGSTVAVVGLSPELRGVLRAVGFLDFFVVADSVAEGVERLRPTGRDEGGRRTARRSARARVTVDA